LKLAIKAQGSCSFVDTVYFITYHCIEFALNFVDITTKSDI